MPQKIKLWNPITSDLLRTLIGHSNQVFSVTFYSNGLLASGSKDKTIKIWNLRTVVVLDTIRVHSGI